MNELPELETICQRCSGKGAFGARGGDDYEECFFCCGSGFIPTEMGARVLSLIRHNARLNVSAELALSSDR